MNNIESWKTCPRCGWVYDVRIDGDNCRRCKAIKRRILVFLIYPVFIFLFILAMSSCTVSMALKHIVREHQRKLVEQEAQLHGRLKLDQDAKQNFYWSMRPTGHWPFNFLY